MAETRRRFLIGLVLLMLSAAGAVIALPRVVKLLPLANNLTVSHVSPSALPGLRRGRAASGIASESCLHRRVQRRGIRFQIVRRGLDGRHDVQQDTSVPNNVDRVGILLQDFREVFAEINPAPLHVLERHQINSWTPEMPRIHCRRSTVSWLAEKRATTRFA